MSWRSLFGRLRGDAGPTLELDHADADCTSDSGEGLGCMLAGFRVSMEEELRLSASEFAENSTGNGSQ